MDRVTPYTHTYDFFVTLTQYTYATCSNIRKNLEHSTFKDLSSLIKTNRAMLDEALTQGHLTLPLKKYGCSLDFFSSFFCNLAVFVLMREEKYLLNSSVTKCS